MSTIDAGVVTALMSLRESRSEGGSESTPDGVPGFSDLWSIANEATAVTVSRMDPALVDALIAFGTGRDSLAARLQNTMTALWIEAFQCGATWSEAQR